MAEQVQISRLTSYDGVRYVDAIVDEGEDGYFTNAARLVDQILRDARICSVLSTRILGLLGKPVEFEPAVKPEPDKKKGRRSGEARARKIAEEIESDWPQMFPRATLAELLTWGLMLGVGIGRIDETCEPWRLDVWHPWALTWDSDARAYYVQTRDNTRLWLTKDKHGQFFDAEGGRWVIYTPYGYDNAGRRGLLRASHRLYLERQWAHRDRSRYSEIYGQPIRVGTAPLNSTKEQRTAYHDLLAPSGAEAVVVLQQGEEGNRWGLEIIEAKGTSTELFQAQIEQLDREIATLFLGQSQSTDGQGGLGNQEKAGESVRLDVMRADADTLADTLRHQFIVPYCEFTYGRGELAPWACWQIDPPEDLAAKATEFKTLIDGMVAAKTAALPIDIRAIFDAHNVPIVSEQEQAAMEKEAEEKKAAEAEAMAEAAAEQGATGETLTMLSETLTAERIAKARALLDRLMPDELDADVLTAALSTDPDDIRQVPERHELFYIASIVAQERMTARGVSSYTWLTRKDKRVRHEHKLLDGKQFAFDAPPVVAENGMRGNPGQFPNCRCKAAPAVRQ